MQFIRRCSGLIVNSQINDNSTVSFILANVEPRGIIVSLLSFWGEPFMSRASAKQVPPYIFRVQGHSDLVAQLVDLERQHRMGDSS